MRETISFRLGIALSAIFFFFISAGMFVSNETTDNVFRPGAAASEAQAFPVFSQKFVATAYCLKGLTFSGVRVAQGIVAADPAVLPIGSIIEVKAGKYSGIYSVLDTGGAIKGKKIDIYIPSYDKAIQFGRRKVEVRIIRRGWMPTGASMSGLPFSS
ncbi:MAG: 3D domain-containing protein [Acidobacteriota bacterium]